MAENMEESARPIGWRICSVVDHRGRITGKHRIVCPRCGSRKTFGHKFRHIPFWMPLPAPPEVEVCHE